MSSNFSFFQHVNGVCLFFLRTNPKAISVSNVGQVSDGKLLFNMIIPALLYVYLEKLLKNRQCIACLYMFIKKLVSSKKSRIQYARIFFETHIFNDSPRFHDYLRIPLSHFPYYQHFSLLFAFFMVTCVFHIHVFYSMLTRVFHTSVIHDYPCLPYPCFPYPHFLWLPAFSLITRVSMITRVFHTWYLRFPNNRILHVAFLFSRK